MMMTETKPTYAAGEAVELKACPFCGTQAKVLDFLPSAPSKCGKHIICHGCDGYVHFPGTDRGIELWNTRRAQWVAVSERLPEVLQDVLLITKYKRVIMGYRDQNASGIFITFSANYPINDITHWLPLDWLPLPETADN